MLGQFKSLWSTTVQSRALIGRRLVINFPQSLDKRVGVLELPRGSSHFFAIKPSKAEGDSTVQLTLVSGDHEELLGVFANEEQAASALGSIRRSFTKPFRKVVKWLIVAMLWAMMVEWATTPTMTPRPGGQASLSESARQMQMAQDAAARLGTTSTPTATPNAPSASLGLTEAVPASGDSLSETEAALRLLQGK